MKIRGTWIVEGSLAVFSAPISEPFELEALTRAERDVADLVVRGFSNAQIASKRGVARTTIAKQLESIYRKLSVRSRTELARLCGAARDRR